MGGDQIKAQDCPADIRLSVGSMLKVVSFQGTRNHECNEVSFALLPQQRRLDEAVKLISLRCNKKVLQEHLQVATGKIVTGRDVSNIRAKLNTNSSKNNIKALVESYSKTKVRTILFFYSQLRQ
ncbi:uncharacterized protein LOC135693127 [Rhopilema esculentum]|uniref:uncharacterized protein LOC135693127 n=1 Tax=Rhopilema esculentum TaxID=499914 RepID=UPI0031DBFC99